MSELMFMTLIISS